MGRREDTLLPVGKEITLLGGEKLRILPWSMLAGKELGPQVVELGSALGDLGEGAIREAVTQFQEDVEKIVVATLIDSMGEDYGREFLEKQCYEDLFTLAVAIFEVCLVREGGGGALGKAMGLMQVQQQQPT